MKRVNQGLSRFFLAPASAAPLAWLRIGVSLTLLLQAALLSNQLFELYGRTGVLQSGIGGYLSGPAFLDLASVSKWLAKLWGWGDREVIGGIAFVYLGSLLALLAGFHARLFAAVAWLTHLALTSGQVTAYGVDMFGQIFLFYLIWVPSGNALSIDVARGRLSSEPSPKARLSLRILQLHLCVVYFFGGFDKAQGPQWWDGDAIWRALMLPLYSTRDMSWLAGQEWLAKAACWGTLLVETGYPVLIWPRRTRQAWIVLTVGMHLGIAIFLGLQLFSLMMACLTLSLFGVRAEGQPAAWVGDRRPGRPSYSKGIRIAPVSSVE